MQTVELLAGWQGLAAEVEQELAAWRAEHRRATLREIEGVVRQAVERLQARYLEDLAHASPATDMRDHVHGGEAAACPECGQALQPRGQQEREVLVSGQSSPLRLRRSYAVCPACGAGLFPPGPGVGPAARSL